MTAKHQAQEDKPKSSVEQLLDSAVFGDTTETVDDIVLESVSTENEVVVDESSVDGSVEDIADDNADVAENVVEVVEVEDGTVDVEEQPTVSDPRESLSDWLEEQDDSDSVSNIPYVPLVSGNVSLRGAVEQAREALRVELFDGIRPAHVDVVSAARNEALSLLNALHAAVELAEDN